MERTSLLSLQDFENGGSSWKYIGKINHDNDMSKGKLEDEEKDVVTSGSSQPSLL